MDTHLLGQLRVGRSNSKDSEDLADLVADDLVIPAQEEHKGVEEKADFQWQCGQAGHVDIGKKEVTVQLQRYRAYDGHTVIGYH